MGEGDCKKYLLILLPFHDFLGSTLKLEKYFLNIFQNMTNVYTFEMKVTTKGKCIENFSK